MPRPARHFGISPKFVRSGWPARVQEVGKGTCPFRPCCGLFKFPELARNHRDECAALVEDLKANGPEKAMATCPVEVRQMIKDALGGNKEEAIRNRASGRDTDTQVYINRSKEQKKIEKPADQSA